MRVQNGYTRIRVAVRPGTEAATQGLARIFPQADAMMAGYTGTYVEGFEVRDIPSLCCAFIYSMHVFVVTPRSVIMIETVITACP
eukprot:COSAG05_NODE_2456_length_3039_cov_2.421088_3_plen_85_part_00